MTERSVEASRGRRDRAASSAPAAASSRPPPDPISGQVASVTGPESAARLRERLLAWYTAHGRDLPWRGVRDPYAIWVSEVMLQQTRVEAVLPRYAGFLARFPSLAALAAAPEVSVLEAWTGLGYYRRARALHAAARAALERWGGAIPDDPERFGGLPGVGAYTTGAVLSIAFGRALPALDGNALRVLARLFAIDGDPRRPPAKALLEAIGALLVPASAPPGAPGGPGEWNQAVMELGARVCIARRPRCGDCPVASLCLARERGLERAIPPARAKRAAPVIEVAVAACIDRGRLLVVRRPDEGLLAGLWGLPVVEGGGEGAGGGGRGGEGASIAGVAPKALARSLAGRLGPALHRWTHAFTHRTWRATLYRIAPRSRARGFAAPGGAEWLDAAALARRPFPTAFKPAIAALLEALRDP